eukprot:m.15423 g.15423  ORF g.15423 m.15423 type:complete len:273 (-) comp4475_c0_seq1:862-1680(-)
MSGDFIKSSHNLVWIRPKEVVAKHLLEATGIDGKSFHIFFANVIEDIITETLGVKNQRIVATAIVYFKRSWISVCWGDLDPCITACTCILLALKTEEYGPVKNLTHFVRNVRQYFLDLKDKYNLQSHLWKYTTAEQAESVLVELEYFLLHLWSCSVIVYQPYRPLLQYCDLCSSDPHDHDKLLEAAWSVVNDSLRTEVSLLYSPDLIALAALFIGATTCNIDVTAWFSKCDVALSDIAEVAQAMLDYFEFRKENKYKPEEVAQWLTGFRLAQ